MQSATDTKKYEMFMSLVHCYICYAVLNWIRVFMTDELLAACSL
jgi:tRNA(Arg) A34 adenosine deaminase TadA